MFSGVGSQTQALKNIKVPHKVIAVSDIDEYADKSYRALHDGNVNNLGDIKSITELPEADLWTYSFPCQDLSVASPTKLGLRGERSGLLFEVERLLRIARLQDRLPKFLLLENVKNLVGKRFRIDFNEWLAFLTSLGYRNYWQVINAKDYIPQNRERVFCVSILNTQAVYEFPAPPVRTAKLRDYLDAEVNGKYYLKIGAVEGKLKTTFHSCRSSVQTRDYCQTLTARDFNDPACVISGNLTGTLKLKDMLDTDVDDKYYLKIGTMESVLRSKFAYNKRKIITKEYCHTLTAMDGTHPTCVITGKLEYAVWNMLIRLTDVEHGGIPLPARNEPIIVAQRGRCPDNPSNRTAGLPTEQRFEFNRDGVCNTLTTVCKDNFVCTIEWDEAKTYTLTDIFNGLRIRKLSEREYWRLMGWRDIEIDKVVAAGVSARQMYKCAGNSIVLPVLEAIFTNLFKDGRLWN